MSDIKYYALRAGEEPPMEFVVIRHVDGEPEFVASYVNSSYLSYENGVLLKMHKRNDALRAENIRLRELVADMWRFTWTACKKYPRLFDPAAQGGQMVQPNMLDSLEQRMSELGIEVDE